MDFFRCTNNGVIAIVQQEVYEQIKWAKLPDNIWATTPYPTPIFTFVDDDYLDHPTYHGYVTGSITLMDNILTGASVFRREFYVPFSNMKHLNGDSAELRFRTTLDDAVKAFGLLKVSHSA